MRALLTVLATVALALTAAAERPRVIVSTDIGGTDPDDFQSMVHLLLYSDVLEIEGLVSSPFGPGREKDILDVIDLYADDYENLRTYSKDYPTPEHLRSITFQGETDSAPHAGFRAATEGSEQIIRRARLDDPRPLHLLVWGGIEDLAQSLHDAPDILPKLRVHFIGGPNKKWSPDAYQYVADRHPELWIIESNSTYRGWFVGGNQDGEWGNRGFVKRHIADHGKLGRFFATQLGGTIKMGDTPTVAWLLKGDPGDPRSPGWGGSFVRAWDRSSARLDRLPWKDDRIEVFQVLEMSLSLGNSPPEDPEAAMKVNNVTAAGQPDGDGRISFRICPKNTADHKVSVRSNVPVLNGQTGRVGVDEIPRDAASRPDPLRPNWWTDDPDPALAEGEHAGARTVSRWREDFLRDFAERMRRCSRPAER